jgi:CRP-like cAMP-binding protein
MTDEEKDEQFYRDTESIAFPKLDDRQLALLEPLGKRRTLRRGEFVFKAGQRDLGLTVILRGEIEVFEARERDRTSSRHRPRARLHRGRRDAAGHLRVGQLAREV